MRRHFRPETAVDKSRMYEPLWDKIAKNTSEKPVRVRCPVGNQERLIRAVRKEKTKANMLRKNVDAVSYGKLIVIQEGEYVLFNLEYNGDMI